MKFPNTIFFCLLISILVVRNLQSQADGPRIKKHTIKQEQIEIQTDRELYITGEVLWFKINVFNKETNEISTYSKVGYIELVGPDGSIVTRVKTELVNGQSAGSITIPKDIISNLYYLRSYTRMMRNFDSELFSLRDVYILNSNQSLLANNSDTSNSSINSGLKSDENTAIKIQIENNSQKVNQRELVELKIKTQNESGAAIPCNVSISVSIPSQNHTDTHPIDGEISSPSLGPNSVFLPESIGMALTGQVLTASSNPADQGIRVYLSFPGKTALVYTALTDSEGRFTFLLPRLYGQRQVVLQLDPNVETNHSIIIEDEFLSNQTVAAETFVLPNHMVALANRTLVNSQIGNSYTPFESNPSYLINDKFTSLPFYGKADKIYKLDDYTRFPLPEFFYEVVPEVRVLGKFGDKYLQIVNDYNVSQRELTPLLLVDGVPVFKQSSLLSINNKLIVSTEIISDPFWLNTVLHNGVIQVISIDGDARSFSLPESALRTNFLTFLPERQFSAPDYSAEYDKNLPDFRNTLYWNPSVTMDENGEASVSFYTSDAIGEYEIRVEAIYKDGQKGKLSNSIEVVKLLK